MTPRPNTTGTIREEAINTFLSELLVDHGISAKPERRTREGTPDVRVTLRSGDLVLLECKWEGSLSLLSAQLDQRLSDSAWAESKPIRLAVPQQANTFGAGTFFQ